MVHSPADICFSRSLNECSRSQNINYLNRCDFYSRATKYFDLITRDYHLTNFGCINVSPESVFLAVSRSNFETTPPS